MSWREWKAYWRKINWTQKWFAIVVLLRPVVDNFYQLKQVSSFLSPIYIVGVLTPILAISSFGSMKRNRIPNVTDEFFRIWGLLVGINCVVILISFFSIDQFGNTIKYITPVLVFFYLRNFIQSKEDLRFILQTFIYSCIVPFGMFAFEIFVHPINPEYASVGRGGGERLRGEYADSMSYAVYFTGFVLVYSYFFLEEIYNRTKDRQTSVIKLSIFYMICLAGVISLRHVSTWSVFLTLSALVLFFNASNMKGIIFMVFIVAIILPFFAETIYEKQISPLIQKEFNVINGDEDIEYSFNGRMQRWERYFEIWGAMGAVPKVLGVSFSFAPQAPVMISGGMHNDYIRQLFLSGIFGLLAYLVFFFLIIRRQRFLRGPERFLLFGSLAMIMLYSVSTLPTIYPGMLNIVYSVFSFALLPARKLYPKSFSVRDEFQPKLVPAT